jgi:hypothetical protein
VPRSRSTGGWAGQEVLPAGEAAARRRELEEEHRSRHGEVEAGRKVRAAEELRTGPEVDGRTPGEEAQENGRMVRDPAADLAGIPGEDIGPEEVGSAPAGEGMGFAVDAVGRAGRKHRPEAGIVGRRLDLENGQSKGILKPAKCGFRGGTHCRSLDKTLLGRWQTRTGWLRRGIDLKMARAQSSSWRGRGNLEASQGWSWNSEMSGCSRGAADHEEVRSDIDRARRARGRGERNTQLSPRLCWEDGHPGAPRRWSP